MSMPNIPNIDPEIKVTRSEAITLILVSIAMEEIALSHIINAEAEKLQKALTLSKTIDDLLRVNQDVRSVLNSVIKKEMLLQFKLEDALKFVYGEDDCHDDRDKKKKNKRKYEQSCYSDEDDTE